MYARILYGPHTFAGSHLGYPTHHTWMHNIVVTTHTTYTHCTTHHIFTYHHTNIIMLYIIYTYYHHIHIIIYLTFSYTHPCICGLSAYGLCPVLLPCTVYLPRSEIAPIRPKFTDPRKNSLPAGTLRIALQPRIFLAIRTPEITS